jgi:Protein of unknown function (DUF3352)
MKRVIAVLVLLTAVIAAALVYFVLNKPAPHAADLLPESTLTFIDIPDLSKSRTEFTKTEFYALWHEPEVQAFLAKPLAALREMAPSVGAPKDADTIGGLVFDAMQGEVFLAVTHVTLFPVFNPGVVCGVDVRTKRIEAVAGLYQLEGQLKRAYPKGTYQTKTYLGVKYILWETEPGYPVCHAFFNSLVVFTYGEDAMRDMIASWTGQVPRDFKRLANSQKFKNVQQHASVNHEFLAYANVEEALNLIGPLLAFAPQTAGMYQKLSRTQAAAYSLSFVDRGIEDVGFIACSSGVPKPTPPTQRKTLALTTPDTLVYSVGSADLAGTYEEVMQSLSQSGSAGMMLTVAQFQQGLRTRGIRMGEDVLQKLGPEFAVIANWRPGTRSPEIAIVSEITDADKLRPALDAAMDALRESCGGTNETLPWDVTEGAGQKLRSVHIGSGLPAPTYALTDQFFILASNPDYARALVIQAKESKPTLATSMVYQQSVKRLPTNGSSYGYADLRGLFTSLYGLMKPILTGTGSSPFVDVSKLPQSETIAKHLFPLVSATVSEPQQTTSTSFSPLGKSLAVVAGVGGAVWAVNTFGPQLQQSAMPIWPKKSSSTAVPSAPTESQTGVSQTPTTP